MAFVAPLATRAAAGSAASAAGGSAAAGAGTKAAAKATPATKAARAPKAPKATAAPDRARQLLEQGTSRQDAARILRDEYGSTLSEAEGLLPAPDAGPASEPTPAAGPASKAPSLPKVPKTVTSAANAGGGLILGTLSYVLALAYLRGGREGVKAWLRAKFLNRTDS